MNADEKLKEWIDWAKSTRNFLPFIPKGGRPYCEPYYDNLSLYQFLPPSPVEVLNDYSGELVNFFRCMQSRDTSEELQKRIMWLPYAKKEFQEALNFLESGGNDPVLRAWVFFAKNGYSRIAVKDEEDEVSNHWLARLKMIDNFRWRAMMAQIDNRDVFEVIRYWDNDEAVFYVAPPEHLSEDHLKNLVSLVLEVKGAVVLMGMLGLIYWPLEERGWKRVDFGNKERKIHRSIWLNQVAQERLKFSQTLDKSDED